jgi:hypothetical protein
MRPLSVRIRHAMTIALSRDVLGTAIKVSAVVGTILTAINHGPSLWQGTFGHDSIQPVQVALCYAVPYCVSTYSAVCAVLQRNCQ